MVNSLVGRRPLRRPISGQVTHVGARFISPLKEMNLEQIRQISGLSAKRYISDIHEKPGTELNIQPNTVYLTQKVRQDTGYKKGRISSPSLNVLNANIPNLHDIRHMKNNVVGGVIMMNGIICKPCHYSWPE